MFGNFGVSNDLLAQFIKKFILRNIVAMQRDNVHVNFAGVIARMLIDGLFADDVAAQMHLSSVVNARYVSCRICNKICSVLSHGLIFNAINAGANMISNKIIREFIPLKWDIFQYNPNMVTQPNSKIHA